jgi:hypothetical protein
MSREEFDLINREELNAEAQTIYDHEVVRRETPAWTVPHPPPSEDASVGSWRSEPDGKPALRRSMAHVKFIAYCYFLVGVISGFYVLFTLVDLFRARPSDPAMMILGVIFAVPCLAIFAGLIRFRPWARKMVRIVAFVCIFSPISWYLLWVMGRPETEELFGGQGLTGEASSLRIT